ncbi:MAG: SNF2-related protein, partial [Pseudobdellovibrionaceae bacterium]
STTKENWFGELEPISSGENFSSEALALECSFIDGESKLIKFSSLDKAEDFLASVSSQLAKGLDSVELDGTNIPISPSFAAMLGDEIERIKPGPTVVREPAKTYRLLIHTNEENVDYSEATSKTDATFTFILPKSLKQDVVLKDHQKIGIGWLSGLLNRDLAKGALLADDMGLGKTLQILTFLAWCIESELEQLSQEQGPYDPILIVAPLILLDNWEKEINRYFEAGVFSPIEKLHGSSLKKYRKEGAAGKESVPGSQTLDIDKLRENRIIITNYETVKNYQYTFARVPWSVVVVDEAQEIKEPSTAVTYALKVLNPTFRIASTGTPVETSLTNLWSIMDFAQPGNPLGSLRNFNKEFGALSYDDPALGSMLREALGFNAENGLVLRRAKKDVLKDLPPKTVIEHFCPMDEKTKDQYESIIQFVQGASKNSGAALQGLHQISQVSQHPFLLGGEPFRSDHREYIAASTKLQKLMQVLIDIKGKSEKALIFARSRRMQDILKAVLDAEFKIDVGIVNGATASRHKYVANTREGIIERFSAVPGFNLLILSPEVAGVGLTITAANHVIHYGRWWNPAKENQATDRAYRIGQTKPVSVHHLILKDQNGGLETFDEKLHRLLKVREDLADNFLAPAGDESGIQMDLVGNLFGSKHDQSSGKDTFNKPSLSGITPYEFECVCALALQSRFNSFFVTPRSGDRGVDVVGISDSEVVLIQCKKSGLGQVCQIEVLDELVDGTDYYREYVIPKRLKSLPLKTVLITTGKFDRATVLKAKANSVELVDGSSFRKVFDSSGMTMSEINALDSSRPRNVDDLAEDLAIRFQKN